MQGYEVGKYNAILLSLASFGQQSASHVIQQSKRLLCKGGSLFVDSLESATPLLAARSLLEAFDSFDSSAVNGEPKAYFGFIQDPF